MRSIVINAFKLNWTYVTCRSLVINAFTQKWTHVTCREFFTQILYKYIYTMYFKFFKYKTHMHGFSLRYFYCL